jgi:hypothetical protein
MSIKCNIDQALNQFKQLAEVPDKVVQQAFRYFVKITPIGSGPDSGNARRNTRLENDTTIVADYVYSERLDKGYSKQAPNGMVKPTEAEIRKLLDREVNKIK